MSTGLPIFDTTVQETNGWLEAIEGRLPSCDRQRAYAALRAVLHVLRDRLPIYRAAAAACLGLLLASPQALASPASAGPVALAPDTATTVNGVELACTGIGQTREDARWRTYPVRIEFSNARNEYLVGAAITVRDAAGRELLSARCDAPWILLRLPKGAYRVEGRILDSAAKARSAPFVSPAAGQLRVVLQFLDA